MLWDKPTTIRTSETFFSFICRLKLDSEMIGYFYVRRTSGGQIKVDSARRSRPHQSRHIRPHEYTLRHPQQQLAENE